MPNYRDFKDYHIERLRDPEDAKVYFSVACDDYKETKDIAAFLLAVGDVAEARGRNFDDFLKEVGILEEVKALAQESQCSHGSRFLQWLQQLVDRLSYSKSKVIWGTAAAVFCVIAFLFLESRVDQNFSEQRSAAVTITPDARPELVQIKMERQVRSDDPTSVNKEDVVHLSLTVPTVIGDDQSKQPSKRPR